MSSSSAGNGCVRPSTHGGSGAARNGKSSSSAARELEDAQKTLEQAQQSFLREKEEWNIQRHTLDQDQAGLETRVRNQRQRIIQQQLEINRLDNLERVRQQKTGESTALVPYVPPENVGAYKETGRQTDKETRRQADKETRKLGDRERKARLSPCLPVSLSPGPPVQDRLAQLERLAGDLADQRLLLLEQWQRLVQTQQHWENDRNLTANDLEALTLRLQDQERDLEQRQRSYEQAENQFRLRHRELTHLRQHLVAWRARLKTRENVLEGEREQLATEVQNREELVEKQLASLTEIRRRWARRRRRDLTQLRADCVAYDQLLQESNILRQALAERTSELEEEKRKLTEKTLALEQYRQEFFVRADHPHAERRLERLRRRWLAQNAATVRNVAKQRETLQAELTAMQTRVNELLQRQQLVSQAEDELAEKQTTFEHQQVLAAVHNARLEQDLQSAASQRQLVEQQLAHERRDRTHRPPAAGGAGDANPKRQRGRRRAPGKGGVKAHRSNASRCDHAASSSGLNQSAARATSASKAVSPADTATGSSSTVTNARHGLAT